MQYACIAYVPLDIQWALETDIHTVFALHPEIFRPFRWMVAGKGRN